jgi:DNA-binding winged helix-turn-helix (wHTH) protein
MSLSFGEFELDRESRQLLRSGQHVPLERKDLELLSLLVERRPRALSRAQIRDVVWPAVFVSESRLNQAVNDIRRALEDDARRPRFIRTVHGFGYAFCGETRDPTERRLGAPWRAFPRLVWADRILSLTAGENLLGRDPGAPVCLDAASVSRRHARILVEGLRATLEDLGSKNGTLVNGERISGSRGLHDGDAVRLGEVLLLFRSLPFDLSTSTEKVQTPGVKSPPP